MKIIADYHTHTVHSHGTGSVDDNVEAALGRGLQTVGIADHSVAHFRITSYNVCYTKLLRAVRQLIWFTAGTLILYITIVVIKRATDFGRMNYFMMAGALGLIAFAFVFAKSMGGARNWVQLGPISFQPSEIAKVFFIIVSAYFFAERRRNNFV